MKKKNNAALIIGIAAAVFVAAMAAAAFFVGKNLMKSPKERMDEGFDKMSSEWSEYSGMLSEKIDFDAIEEFGKTGTLRTSADVSVIAPDIKDGSMNLKIDALANTSEKLASCRIGAGMYGVKLDIGEIAATPDALYIISPAFVKDAYKVDLTDISSKFNDSEWSSIAGTQLPEGFVLKLFETEDDYNPLKEIKDIFSESVKSAWENAAFEKIEEKKDGLYGVRVTIDKDSADECIEKFKQGILESRYYETSLNTASKFQDYAKIKDQMDQAIEDAFSSKLNTDVVLEFYLDKKGRIVNIITPSDIETEDGASISVDIKFTGEERVLDIIGCDAALKENGKAVSISYKNKIDIENMSFDMEFMADADGSGINFKVDGGFEDMVKGEGCTFRVNNASLEAGKSEVFRASAVMELEISDKLPEIPKNYVNLLDMNQMEIYAMFYEIMDSVGKLGL